MHSIHDTHLQINVVVVGLVFQQQVWVNIWIKLNCLFTNLQTYKKIKDTFENDDRDNDDKIDFDRKFWGGEATPLSTVHRADVFCAIRPSIVK